MLIVFEGIDGSGKSTQVKLLKEALEKRNIKVRVLSEPSDSIYGKEVRRKLSSGEYTPLELYHLFVKDREISAKKIKSLLKDGYIVIMDRYYISTIAYQGAQGISITKIIRDHKKFPQPNLIFILDIDPYIALSRLKAKDSFENIEFLKEVRRIYLSIPRILKIPCCKIMIINAEKNPEKIHIEILEVVLDYLRKRRRCNV